MHEVANVHIAIRKVGERDVDLVVGTWLRLVRGWALHHTLVPFFHMALLRLQVNGGDNSVAHVELPSEAEVRDGIHVMDYFTREDHADLRLGILFGLVPGCTNHLALGTGLDTMEGHCSEDSVAHTEPASQAQMLLRMKIHAALAGECDTDLEVGIRTTLGGGAINQAHVAQASVPVSGLDVHARVDSVARPQSGSEAELTVRIEVEKRLAIALGKAHADQGVSASPAQVRARATYYALVARSRSESRHLDVVGREDNVADLQASRQCPGADVLHGLRHLQDGLALQHSSSSHCQGERLLPDRTRLVILDVRDEVAVHGEDGVSIAQSRVGEVLALQLRNLHAVWPDHVPRVALGVAGDCDPVVLCSRRWQRRLHCGLLRRNAAGAELRSLVRVLPQRRLVSQRRARSWCTRRRLSLVLGNTGVNDAELRDGVHVDVAVVRKHDIDSALRLFLGSAGALHEALVPHAQRAILPTEVDERVDDVALAETTSEADLRVNGHVDVRVVGECHVDPEVSVVRGALRGWATHDAPLADCNGAVLACVVDGRKDDVTNTETAHEGHLRDGIHVGVRVAGESHINPEVSVWRCGVRGRTLHYATVSLLHRPIVAFKIDGRVNGVADVETTGKGQLRDGVHVCVRVARELHMNAVLKVVCRLVRRRPLHDTSFPNLNEATPALEGNGGENHVTSMKATSQAELIQDVHVEAP
mmetsp:Transcript_64776/g.166705  ORF Transcript_64776/g.166705 Transcript_64776/m.166705 type:complete len:704 (+) Transcript_64776:1501-3612(+)